MPTQTSTTADVPQQIAAAWPPAQWRDVHVLAAVSGGADSIALLRALLELKQDQAAGRGQLFAAHVNHGLRGEASDADETWLRDQCKSLGVELRVAYAPTAELAAEQGDGVEAAARAARYHALTTIAEKLGARFVAIAHTCDDQIETTLFRFLRGSGLRGLAGIPATRPLSSSVTLFRPLLACSREDVLAYLKQLQQPYREDATNSQLDFARNRIRHELLPYLREHFNAEVDAAIARTAELAAEHQQVVEVLAIQILAQCREGARQARVDASIVLATRPLADQPPLAATEVLRRAWREAQFPEQSMSHRWWRALAQFAQADSPPTLNLPGDIRALARPRAC